MKLKLAIALLVITSVGCYQSKEPSLSPEQLELLERQRQDSIQLVLDSVMLVQIKIPRPVDTTFFSNELIEQFHEMATRTSGELKVVVKSTLIIQTIKEIINENATKDLDLMIIMDKTGSMMDDIISIKTGVKEILDELGKRGITRIAIATYGDKNFDGVNWFDYMEFDDDLQRSIEYINSIRVTGGADYPESVIDGVYMAIDSTFWKSTTKKIAIVLGDAPSHIGALSSHTIDNVVNKAISREIDINLYPIVLSPENADTRINDYMQQLPLIESVYPIPSKGLITLKVSDMRSLTYEIYNVSGALIQNGEVSKPVTRLDLQGNEPGLYILRVIDDRKNFDQKKLIIN